MKNVDLNKLKEIKEMVSKPNKNVVEDGTHIKTSSNDSLVHGKENVSRILMNLNENMQKAEVIESELEVLKQREEEAKRQNKILEDELNNSNVLLEERLDEFAKKVLLIKKKNEEIKEKTREMKLQAVKVEESTLSEIHNFRENNKELNELSEKLERIKSFDKEIAKIEKIDELVTQEIDLNITNEFETNFSKEETEEVEKDSIKEMIENIDREKEQTNTEQTNTEDTNDFNNGF